MYGTGRGVTQDYGEAVRWYRRAAEQGHVSGQYNLGFMYGNGRGVVQDDTEAVRWYRRAAEQGHALGQTNLGVMYGNGRGVVQDDTEAVRWYRRAAEQGYVSGQYQPRLHVPQRSRSDQDDGEAVRWYRRAADQGHVLAQANLGWIVRERSRRGPGSRRSRPLVSSRRRARQCRRAGSAGPFAVKTMRRGKGADVQRGSTCFTLASADPAAPLVWIRAVQARPWPAPGRCRGAR